MASGTLIRPLYPKPISGGYMGIGCRDGWYYEVLFYLPFFVDGSKWNVSASSGEIVYVKTVSFGTCTNYGNCIRVRCDGVSGYVGYTVYGVLTFTPK